VPASDLISAYTKSGNMIVNGLHASCQSEDDGTDYFLKTMDLIARYASPIIP
jgi:hypothetical protein